MSDSALGTHLPDSSGRVSSHSAVLDPRLFRQLQRRRQADMLVHVHGCRHQCCNYRVGRLAIPRRFLGFRCIQETATRRLVQQQLLHVSFRITCGFDDLLRDLVSHGDVRC